MNALGMMIEGTYISTFTLLDIAERNALQWIFIDR